MRKTTALLIASLMALSYCSVLTDDDDIDFGDSGLLRNSLPLSPSVLQHLVGNYTGTASTSLFRGLMTIKSANSRIALYSYDAETFAVMNAGCVNNAVIFEGKTRDPASQSTGLIRLRIDGNQGGAQICAGSAPTIPHVRYSGTYGTDKSNLTETISLQYGGPLKSTGNTYIISHHGCRTVDKCGASENSLEGIKYAGYLGANAVEVDVLLSKDGIPFLYHDTDFNSRLTNGIFCLGDVTNYTILMMKVFCRLKYGELIPTLREALTALMSDDTIKMIWLDPKSTDVMPTTVALANEFQSITRANGSKLEILIGQPDEDYTNAWLAASGHETTACLVEYSFPATMYQGCRAYGPRFTLGPLPSESADLHAANKLLFYWTVNDKSFYSTYLGYGGADGIITDRPFLLYSYFQQ